MPAWPQFDDESRTIASIDGDELVVDGRRVRLTGSEARVVGCLLQRRGNVVSRAELTQSLWGAPDKDAGRAIDTHIRRIREKLNGIPGVGITTVRMRGFRFESYRSAGGLSS